MMGSSDYIMSVMEGRVEARACTFWPRCLALVRDKGQRTVSVL